MIEKKKVRYSCARHPDVGAAVYCKECKMFMCAETCQGMHNDFFGERHQVVSTDSLTDFAPSGGKCATHKDYVLDFVCMDCDGKRTK